MKLPLRCKHRRRYRDGRSGGTAGVRAHRAASISARDLSYVNEMEDCGAVYRLHGKPIDPFSAA